MNPDYSVIVQRRDNRFILISLPYGIVIWADDVTAGIKELQDRVDAVAKEYSAAGVDIDTMQNLQLASGSTLWKQSLWRQYMPFFVKMTVVVVFVATILSIEFAILSYYFGPNSSLGFALRHPAQTIVRIGDLAEQLPDARVEEMRTAIGKVTRKLGPIINDLKAPGQTEKTLPGSPPDATGSTSPRR